MNVHRLRKWVRDVFYPNRYLWAASAGLTVLLLGIEAFARAGGGQNYSGGGGGGGGFGGGGGGGEPAWMIIYLVIRYPQVGVPLAVVAVGVAAFKYIRNPDRTTARAVKDLESMAYAPSVDLSGITSRDPNFDEAAFLSRVEATEMRVQEAWSKGDMSPVRHLLSDGLMRRFSTQLLIFRQQGIRNVTADHRVLKTEIFGVLSDRQFDTVHVAVEAEARDTDANASLSYEEAVAVVKKRKLESYVEIWSFLRRQGATSKTDDALLEGRCPNCGASLASAQSTRCDHCKALVNSGQYDWVLAEITQAEEWNASSTGKVKGLKAMEAMDPGFNRQTIEDRASYLFWRWIEALVKGEVAPLAKVASKSFKGRTAQAVSSGPGRFFKTAVGAVDLVACEADADGQDLCHVRVLWSSARSSKDTPAHQANVLSLCRKTGAKDDSGFSYAHCPECHGPLTENDSPTCDFCGTALDAGEKDWVLDAVIQPEALRLRPRDASASDDMADRFSGLVPDMGNSRERVLLLMRMAAVVMADGVVTKAEMKMLKNAAKRWAVPFDAALPILQGEVGVDEIAGMKPSNPTGFFQGLVAAALVDGRIDAKERRLLLDVAKNLEISSDEAELMMKEMVKKAG